MLYFVIADGSIIGIVDDYDDAQSLSLDNDGEILRVEARRVATIEKKQEERPAPHKKGGKS